MSVFGGVRSNLILFSSDVEKTRAAYHSQELVTRLVDRMDFETTQKPLEISHKR